jgi:anti-sigma B factor antagonist
METELHVNESRDGSVHTLQVTGEVDVATTGQLESTAMGAMDTVGRRGVVELDMREVSFMDSSGLRMLMTLRKRAEENDVDLVLRSPSRPVQRLLELTSLAEHFTIR